VEYVFFHYIVFSDFASIIWINWTINSY